MAAVSGGGTAERTFQMCRFLVKNDHDCSLLTLNLGLTPERLKDLKGVDVFAVPCLSKRFLIPKGSYTAIKQIVADCDIIHLMGHWTILNALVYYFVAKQKKPYVVCPAGSLPIFGRSKLKKKLYDFVVGKRIIHDANRCIAITNKEAMILEQAGVDGHKISIIPNGICPEDYSAKDDLAFRHAHNLSGAPFLLFMGRLNPIKGPDILLRAFCEIKNEFPHHLVFAGPDGGLLHELQEMARQAEVAHRVHFVGYLDRYEKSLAYHAAQLLVIPSRSDAMSIVVLEAGATATPVLLTDQCGFNDVAENGGGLVVPATEAGIRAGLSQILSRPCDLGIMGDKLKNYTDRLFTWDSVVQCYISLYKELTL